MDSYIYQVLKKNLSLLFMKNSVTAVNVCYSSRSYPLYRAKGIEFTVLCGDD